MIYRLVPKVQPYAWGTYDFIPKLLGKEPTGGPQAELWIGTHPLAPSDVIIDGRQFPLSKFLDQKGLALNLLFKVLSARTALSVQVHPTIEQAKFGFLEEEKLMIPITDPKRNYKDPRIKPELAMALTDFWMLAGFRPINEIVNNLSVLAPSGLEQEIKVIKSKGIKDCFRSLITKDVKKEILANAPDNDMGRWIRELNRQYKDMGILAPAYLNLIKITPGQAVLLKPGLLHSYLEGTILEPQLNSDNVLRAGLTPKHINVDELLKIVDFHSSKPEIMEPSGSYKGLGYRLYKTKGARKHGSELLLCLSGSGKIISDESFDVKKGDSFFAPENEEYIVKGDAVIFSQEQ